MIKLEFYNDEQRLRHLAMLRLITKDVRNPQTYQITEEVNKMKSKDYNDKSSPEEITSALDIIIKIFEKMNKEQVKIEEEIENEVFPITGYWGNDYE